MILETERLILRKWTQDDAESLFTYAKKSKRVQEKLGFIYHHTCDEVPVPLLNEVRVGHTNVITKEQWKSHTQPDGKIHVANIEEV